MNGVRISRKWYVVAVSMLLVAAVVRFVIAKPRAPQDDAQPYRVELVTNNPYRMQSGLNELSQQGWDLVTAIPRTDGKILLILRK